MLPLLYRLRNTLISIFSFQNILLQIFACFISYLIVISGFDWAYFKLVHNSSLSTYLSPAVAIGGLLPIFGIPLLYITAKLRKDRNLLTLVWALAQAATLGWIISSVYKAFTGRVQPPRVISNTLIDMSRDWNFGFLNHGIFWGWPSSHTTVAFAMSFTLITLYLKNRKVFWIAFFYAVYIGLGISMQIHWFSEFAAGAILGTMIGFVVGTNFRSKLTNIS